jgi:hypothetical protein
MAPRAPRTRARRVRWGERAGSIVAPRAGQLLVPRVRRIMAPRAHRQQNCTVSSTPPLEPWPTPEPLPPAARGVASRAVDAEPCCRAPLGASRRGARGAGRGARSPRRTRLGSSNRVGAIDTHLEGGDNGSNGLGGTRRGTLQARGAHRVGAAENLNGSNGARVSISQAAGAPRAAAAAACAWCLRSKNGSKALTHRVLAMQGAGGARAGRGRGAGGAAPRTRARARAVPPLARRAPLAACHSPEWIRFPP